MDFSHDSSPGYLANHLARLFARRIERRLKPLGITLGTFPALLNLWEKDRQTQKELVERLGIEQPTLAATLTRMERDGLVTRQRDAGDARVQHICLTDHARRLRDPAVAAAIAVNAEAMAGLDPAEEAQLIALIGKVIATLEAAPDSPE